MPVWLATLLEIIKITVPALVVFLTVKYLMQGYLNKEYQLKALDIEKKRNENTLPLKLQAYERLSLFCERISVPTLLFRVKEEGMSARQLRLQMLLAIQQEYEHNITQQVYVSAQLWEIIQIARDDSVNTISIAMESIESQASAQELTQALFRILEQRGGTAVDKALLAIKKEAGVLLK
ncbi:MAG TPA: hypothetical protein VJ953_11430 [Saprospiraceae bacterium]|nr:hypothetical protein [Saprospiraceae bacterium]